MRTLCFVTSNPNKVKEAMTILKDCVIEPVQLDLLEVQGSSEEIAALKAQAAAEDLGKPCFAEDVSLRIRALGGMPGPYIKHFASAIGPEGLWKMVQAFDDKHAEAVCIVAYCKPGEDPVVFEGIAEGEIVAPRGTGWGFDAVFQPKGSSKTYGEMTPEQKNLASHRGIALWEFGKWLAEGN